MTEIIQVSDDGDGEVHVYYLDDEGECTAIGTYKTRSSAERAAQKAAKVYGCEWEANY